LQANLQDGIKLHSQNAVEAARELEELAEKLAATSQSSEMQSFCNC